MQVWYQPWNSMNFYLDSQTPTSKQSRYKEQVAELRKGRNSGLQKEQKEKHMVHQRLCTSFITITADTPVLCLHIGLYIVLALFLFLSGSTGASADTRQHQRASAGKHHQWLWPGALQESPGPCIWRPGNELFHVSVKSDSCIQKSYMNC